MKKNKRALPHKYVHSRILIQLVIFSLIFLGLTGMIAYDTITQALSLLWILGGALLGVLIGIAAGRMFALKWHEDAQKIILSMDKLGFLLVGVYIVFRVLSEQLLGGLLHGQELTVTTFGLLAGIMLGRLLSLITNIRKILTREGIL